MTDEPIGTSDVDIKMRTRPNGLWEFDLSADGDFVGITGIDLVKQRIAHRIFVRKRFYPPVINETMLNDEILKQNIDDEGRHFIPGDLDKLGHPNYGSLISQYISINDETYLKGLLVLDFGELIGREAIDNNIRSVKSITIDKSRRDAFKLSVGLVIGKAENIETTDLEVEL